MEKTMTKDESTLQAISILNYVLAGFQLLGFCCPVMHLGMGAMMMIAPDSMGPPPGQGNGGEIVMFRFMGGMVVLFAGGIMLFSLLLAFLFLKQARDLGKRENYKFCFIISAIQCLIFPFGTALGVWTLVMLMKDDVKELFRMQSGSAELMKQ